MLTDVAGRVRNVQLASSKSLWPLFEAISNSFDAIKDGNEQNGLIEIFITRDDNSIFAVSKPNLDRQLAEVTGFEVRDNGIGFDEHNYKEFNVADTRNKASQGGKGIGRFVYLAAFDRVEVDSVYYISDQAMRREFTFSQKDDGIGKHTCDKIHNARRLTTVRLVGYKDKYRKQCPKRAEIIAAYIVEQFLDVFMGSQCPKMILHDDSTDTHIDLDRFYDEEMVINSKLESIVIKNQPFDIVHVQLHTKHISEHRMYFCARESVVKSEKLIGISNLAPRLRNSDDREFVYAVYISSSVLNDSVNNERTEFILADRDGGLIPEEITLEDIRKSVRESCKIFLSPFTEPIKQKKEARIDDFVHNEGVMYRPILKRMKNIYDRIGFEATDDEIDNILYAGYQELQASLKKEAQSLIKTENSETTSVEEFEKQYVDYFAKICEVNSSDLARYVCHRKAVIEFLKRQLGYSKNGKYHNEDRIHKIIFPQGVTSDEVMFEDHNLWLIDEKLAFHIGLSSDKPISQSEYLINVSKKEPDILIFNRVISFCEQSEAPFNSVTIIEFKKPQRNAYSEEENPFIQIDEYLQDILNGKAKRLDGRSFPVPANTPFYCYIICDITPNLEMWARRFNLKKTPDGNGFFGFRNNPDAYWEVVPFSKLVGDAEKRHYAFFEKLGLPKTKIDVNK